MDQPHKPDFDPHALRVLEYARVIDHLAEYASTELGRHALDGMQNNVVLGAKHRADTAFLYMPRETE